MAKEISRLNFKISYFGHNRSKYLARLKAVNNKWTSKSQLLFSGSLKTEKSYSRALNAVAGVIDTYKGKGLIFDNPMSIMKEIHEIHEKTKDDYVGTYYTLIEYNIDNDHPTKYDR